MFGFWVGAPQSVHRGKFGGSCARAFQKKLGITFDDEGWEPYCSNDCSWKGLGRLHKLIAEQVGEKYAREIEYSEAFLPIDIRHRKFNFNIFGTSFLRVSSLQMLSEAVEAVSRAKDWPFLNDEDSARLTELRSKELLFEDDLELYTYCELIAAVAVAKRRRLPLWVA